MRPSGTLSRLTTVAAIALVTTTVLGPSAVGAVTGTPGTWSTPDVIPWVTDRGPALDVRSITGAIEVPDGTVVVYGEFQDAGGDPTADNVAQIDLVTGDIHGFGSNGAGDGIFDVAITDAAWYRGQLWVVGPFVDLGGAPAADGLAVWNGSSWGSRGTVRAPSTDPFGGGTLVSLATGNGKLYLSGDFDVAGDARPPLPVAEWDGYEWSAVGDGLDPSAAPLPATVTLTTIAVGPDGTVCTGGVGGYLVGVLACTNSGGDGFWHGMGGDVADVFSNGYVRTIAFVPSLWVGGDFAAADGVANTAGVARWDGSAWRAVGGGLTGSSLLGDSPIGGPLRSVRSITSRGSIVFLAGAFDAAGGTGIVAWNGTAYSRLGSSGPVWSADVAQVPWVLGLLVHGSSLFAVGEFDRWGSFGAASRHAARFTLPGTPTSPRSLVGTAGVGRVALSWAAPTSNGGSAITDYVVQYRLAGTTTWRRFADGVRTTRAATVTGLRRGVIYQFRVCATSFWGQGACTAAIATRTT